MHSLLRISPASLVALAGLGLAACSHTPAAGDDGASDGDASGSLGGATSSNTSAASTTTGSDTTSGNGASASTSASGGATGAGGTGAMASTIVPGAEAFDCTASDGSNPSVTLTQLVDGLDSPLGIYFAPGDPSRGYITLASGRILLLEGGTVSDTPFLDISDRIEREDVPTEERGLLGMAFHPDFQTNGKFYLNYTSGGADTDNGQNNIAEFTVSSDPNVADANSGNVLLTIPQPDNNHNGGALAIGLDGNLYISVGDGGFRLMATADAHKNGQNPNTLLGTILRIGLDGSVPAGNMPNAAPEVWDIGLRNPWRISFDGCTGDLYIADVGFEGELTSSEEINVEPAMTGSKNYGWPIMEGDSCRESGCDTSAFVLPTDFYGWISGSAVIGGYVYRGSAIPGLRGTYIYADYLSGTIRALEYAGGVASNSRDLRPSGTDDLRTIVSFGQDPSGEVYVVAWSGPPEMTQTDGQIYRIDPQ